MLVTADRALLGGLIDYTGLLPPASLTMQAAGDEYRRARRSPHSRMLSRFVCPASRLEELAGLLMASMRVGEAPWPVSVILDGRVASAAVLARNFDAEMDPAAAVVMVEVPLVEAACSAVEPVAAAHEMAPTVRAALSVSPSVTPYFEIRRTSRWPAGIAAAVAALASHRERERRPLGAVLRCGGSDATEFPTVEEVVLFMTACRTDDLPFKATAGLERPVRHPDEDTGVMRHGFINLLVAAALCEEGADDATIARALEEEDALAFRLGPATVRWREVPVSARAVRHVRHSRFASVGSSRFFEPVDELVELGMLAGAS